MTTLAEFENLRLAEALCRTDFVSFVYQVFRTLTPASTLQINYHIWSMAYHLELVRLGVVKRLIINLPPRSLKSMVTSVAFPAFVLGHDPGKRLIVASYGADLAIKLNNDFRAVVNEPWFQLLFPTFRISRMKNTEFEVTTTRNGYRLATSIDGSLTGRGGDILIVDDPLKPAEALSDNRREWVNNWHNNTLVSRLDDIQAGAIIVVMQRLHDGDLTGALLRSSEKWVQLKLSAIAEEREEVCIGPNRYHIRHVGDVLHPERGPRSVLESIRSLDPDMFAAHYQQAPIPPSGIMLKRQWMRYYDELPPRKPSSHVIQSWDTASQDTGSNDWSVCTTWLIQEDKYYLMDVLRERLPFPTLRKRAIEHARKHNPIKIFVEDDLLGKALVGELKNVGLLAIPVKPEASKQIRMKIQSAKFEGGLVFFPKHASWLHEYEAELLAFPNARFDDQVDSTSQALASNHSAFDLGALADGMARLNSGLAFNKYFAGRVV